MPSPRSSSSSLEPGDVLFLYTDGLTSACGPDMTYFEDRLIDELAALAGKPPAVLVSRVQEVVGEFCQNVFRDDLTMLAIQAGPARHLTAQASADRAAPDPAGTTRTGQGALRSTY